MYGKSFDFVAADIACDLKKEKYKFMIKKIVPSKMKIIIKRFLKKG